MVQAVNMWLLLLTVAGMRVRRQKFYGTDLPEEDWINNCRE
jgi:hypothetical protein